ncbi:MAG TPA: site-2 protease family protein [Planctomycetota bacterium]|jgi:Zn-dependent protease
MDHAPKIILSLLALFISVIFHEQMHARVAWWLGDPTGKNDNRLSWNPIHHIDPFMTLLLPIVLYLGSGGRFIFGGAKPVQINPLHFRNPSLGMCLSAAAGPVSNFFLAGVGFALCVTFVHAVPSAVLSDGALTWNGFFLVTFVFINLLLGAFNLLPIPPLDGSRILRHFVPGDLRAVIDAVEPYGLFITMFLVYLGAAQVITPLVVLCLRAFEAAAGPVFAMAAEATLYR